MSIPVSRPTALKTVIKRWAVNKAPFVHARAKELFERRTHRRIITLYDTNQEVLQLLNKYLDLHALRPVDFIFEYIDYKAMGFQTKSHGSHEFSGEASDQTTAGTTEARITSAAQAALKSIQKELGMESSSSSSPSSESSDQTANTASMPEADTTTSPTSPTVDPELPFYVRELPPLPPSTSGSPRVRDPQERYVDTRTWTYWNPNPTWKDFAWRRPRPSLIEPAAADPV